jgi:transcription termination factor Rho
MSSVLDRDELGASPLADLHLIANELGVDGFRRLRKADLVEAIISRQYGGGGAAARPHDDGDAEPALAEADADADADAVAKTGDAAAPSAAADGAEERRGRRSRRGGRSRSRDRVSGDGAHADRDDDRPADGDEGAPPGGYPGPDDDRIVVGVVELMGNGSGFLRLDPHEPTDDDVYVSAAQVKRCELVSGDRVSGPVRRPRRSERFPSLVRIDTINGRPADEVAEGTRFDDLQAAFPTERLDLKPGKDTLLKGIELLAPFGKGSRVTVAGPPLSGKSEALRRIAAALAGTDGLELIVALAGVRPEEVADWTQDGLPAPAAVVTMAAGSDAHGQAIEQAIEQGRRVAARGADAVVVVDALADAPAAVVRRALSAARNVVDGGSLTVIAAAAAPLGGETTLIVLDGERAARGRYGWLDVRRSATMRADALLGAKGAEKLVKERANALDD